MAHIGQDTIYSLWVRSKQVIDELNYFRDQFKWVRDGNITAGNYQMKEQHFLSTMHKMIEHSNIYQRRYFGTPSETQHKNKEYEETIARYEKKIEAYKQQLLQEQKEKDEALTRVSALASQLLTPGNPDIADISDKNRPTRLAEDFKNLYDDEWTDAFEYMTEECKWRDEDAIRCLYDLLKLCHEVSSDELKKQYKEIEKMITFPKILKSEKDVDPRTQNPTHQGQDNQLKDQQQQQKNFARTMGAVPSREFRKSVLGREMNEDMGEVSHLESSLMEFRKTIAVDVLKTVTPQDLLGAVTKKFGANPDLLKNQHVTNFLTKCFKLCWLMGVQYPPMEMDFSHQQGQPMKQELFKVYRTKGEKIAMVVWPPVFLHHNGPLVCMGYAECTKS